MRRHGRAGGSKGREGEEWGVAGGRGAGGLPLPPSLQSGGQGAGAERVPPHRSETGKPSEGVALS